MLEREGVRLAVANLCGRVGMDPHYDDPFAAADGWVETMDTPHLFLDFHAEATSEKIAMGWHLDGRATAVVGTHTTSPPPTRVCCPEARPISPMWGCAGRGSAY